MIFEMCDQQSNGRMAILNRTLHRFSQSPLSSPYEIKLVRGPLNFGPIWRTMQPKRLIFDSIYTNVKKEDKTYIIDRSFRTDILKKINQMKSLQHLDIIGFKWADLGGAPRMSFFSHLTQLTHLRIDNLQEDSEMDMIIDAPLTTMGNLLTLHVRRLKFELDSLPTMTPTTTTTIVDFFPLHLAEIYIDIDSAWPTHMVRALEQCTHLRYVDLNVLMVCSMEQFARWMKAWKQLESLKIFWGDGLQVDTHDMIPVVPPLLTRLAIPHSLLPSSLMPWLMSMRHSLQSLDLPDHDHDEGGLPSVEQLCSFSNLISLGFGDYTVPSHEYLKEYLSTSRAPLRVLNLANVKLSNDSKWVEAIGSITTLTALELGSALVTKLDSTTIRCLNRVRSLMALSLGLITLADGTISSIVETFPNLMWLEIESITDDDLSSLSKLSSLVTLRAERCKSTLTLTLSGMRHFLSTMCTPVRRFSLKCVYIRFDGTLYTPIDELVHQYHISTLSNAHDEDMLFRV